MRQLRIIIVAAAVGVGLIDLAPNLEAAAAEAAPQQSAAKAVAPAPDAGSAPAASPSLAREPAAAANAAAAQGQPAGVAATSATAAGIRVLRDVVFAEVSGEKLLADIFLPPGHGPFPGVLLIHGGGWIAGDKSEMSRLGTMLARRGYTAVSVNYRLAPAHKFPAQLQDVRTALAWIRRTAGAYKVDPSWLAVFGYSAGGQLAALLALTEGEADEADAATQANAAGLESGDQEAERFPRLRALVAGGAPCDFCHIPLEQPFLSYWLGGSRGELPEAYEAASPVRFVTPDDPPTFIFHGEKDGLVAPQQSEGMVGRLREVGVPVESYTVPDAGHIRTFFDRGAAEAALKFLDRQRAADSKQAQP